MSNPPTSKNNAGQGFFKGSGFDARRDLTSSIVVFLVALPLCIGIAVAVGVNPARALITGIVGGIVVGFFSGSPLQVSGPAAGLFVIIADLLQNAKDVHGGGEAEAMAYALTVLGVAVFLAGVIQFVAGNLGLGQWFRAVSPAVINGMLAGIGVLILTSQFHVMLDHIAMWHGEKAHGGLQYMATIPEAIYKAFSADTEHNHHLAATIGLITIGIIIAWQKLAPKQLKLIPAALVAIIAATAFALISGFETDKIVVPESLAAEITLPSWESVQLFSQPWVLLAGLVIAIIASAETLLCATAVDQMQTRVRTNYDKELCAQGLGNMVCGVLGALPMTGVIVRSSANVQAGARSRYSAIIHGGWLLLFVVAIPWMLEYVPKAAFGALLVYTGFKLVNLKAIRELWNLSRVEAAIYFATLGLIICTDLLIGVLVGVGLSALNLLYKFTRFGSELVVSEDRARAELKLSGSATFLRLPILAKELEDVPDNAELHVDIHALTYIDHACLDLLMNWAKQHESGKGRLVLDWDLLRGRFRQERSPAEGPVFSEGRTLAELPVGELKGEGMRLSDVALHVQQVLVMGIKRRNGTYVETPNGMTSVEAGDVLVCYGHRDTLKSLGPQLQALDELASQNKDATQDGEKVSV